MQVKKPILILILLGLFIAQFATAYHTAAHIDHEISVITLNHDHQDHDDHKKSKHQCPECVLSKTLQVAFFHSSTYIFQQSYVEKTENKDTSVFVSYLEQKSNNPRAPPSFLI